MSTHSHHHGHHHHAVEAVLEPLVAAQAKDGSIRTPMRIMQMDCPTEEALIRKKLAGMKGIRGITFNLMQRVLTVDHAPDALAAIVAAIRELGFEPEVAQNGKAPPPAPAAAHAWGPLVLAGLAALSAEAAGWLTDLPWPPIVLAILALSLSGVTTYKKGWVAIANGNLNINALMSIAVTGAVLLDEWPEAAMVMVLFAIAEAIEARSLDRARHAIERLMEVAPANVLAKDASGQWISRPAADVPPGTLLRVRPGERFGLDGHITAGSSAVNQAPITGESMPVQKEVGDAVFAGTINGMAELEYRSGSSFDDTLLARIIHAVHEAQGSKAPTQRFVDRFARVYTPLVCALAVGIAVVPPLLFQEPWLEWVYKALVLLVIACPCALVISTPVAIVSGLAAAARHGILIKGGVYLEQGRKLTWLALDKTGTLTAGTPQQTGMVLLDSDAGADDCQRIASALAARSDHPVSRAIALAGGHALARSVLAVQNIVAVSGGGISGDIHGRLYLLGNYRWVKARLTEAGAGAGDVDLHVEASIRKMQEEGQTVTALANQDRVLALFGVSDTLRGDSAQAVAELRGLGLRTAMLSGDNANAAQIIGRQAGVDEVHADMLPEHKLDRVAQYANDGLVGMVGDGINDAPALARADIGFAMGVMGTDTAIETADVALMDDDLRKVGRFIRLSRATHAVLVQNIAAALGIKLVFLVLTLLGLGTMWMAVFADVGASLLVLGNSLRLLRK
ncbi:MAG TPA: heavy metal translocating P-type ATPase [Burkholderiaceae bacterium]|nr:heavy metal translocating P-type ATPase [Burkholderiaceae bacterium]